jgi:ribosomal protein S16
MLKIRLARAGKRNSPFFRVVLTEHTAPSKSGYKDVLGFYNPISKEFSLKDAEKVKTYLSQ